MTTSEAELAAGLFDGFEEYLSATTADYRNVITTGMVAVDANVLLNLYRYNAQTRADLFAILRKLDNRLWVPHQALFEFWNHRETVLRDHDVEGGKTLDELEKLRDSALQAIRRWANRTALAEHRRKEISSCIDEAFGKATESIRLLIVAEQEGLQVETYKDPVLQGLSEILGGKVGLPMAESELVEATKEATKRIAEGRPPGYKDAGKSDGRAAGDYLVWAQILKEAGRRSCDVLFVTGDVKEDWWHRANGKTVGPRRELIREMLDSTKVRLFAMRPESLLREAQEFLDVEIGEGSIENVARVEQYLRTTGDGMPSHVGSDVNSDLNIIGKLPEGRTGDYLEAVTDMARLAENSPTLEAYLDAFQERFSTITLRSEARRRMRTLVALGLADISADRVELTDAGKDIVFGEQRLEVLRDQFMTRIAGASEVLELAKSIGNPSAVRQRLRELPPAGLSVTQAMLVHRWLGQLGLVREAPDPENE